MSGIRTKLFEVAAITMVMVALGTLPASAVDEAATSEPAVIADATGATPAAVSARGDSAVPLPPRRPRLVQAPSPRPAVVNHREWGCSGAWCGRQFVLMLGVGF